MVISFRPLNYLESLDIRMKEEDRLCSPAFDLNPNEENVEGAVGAGISKDMNVLDEEMKISYRERDESIGCSCCLVVHRGRRRRLFIRK